MEDAGHAVRSPSPSSPASFRGIMIAYVNSAVRAVAFSDEVLDYFRLSAERADSRKKRTFPNHIHKKKEREADKTSGGYLLAAHY